MKLKIIFGSIFVLLLVVFSRGSESVGTMAQRGERIFTMAVKTFEYNAILSGKTDGLLLASAIGAFSTKSKNIYANDVTSTFLKNDELSVPVILYHGIVETSDRFNITPKSFFEQMKALKVAGYTTITPEQFKDFMDDKNSLPKKPILITFDDGRKDSYYGAHPVLKTFGYKATMFVATGASFPVVGKSNNYYLSDDELGEMSNSGIWSIQSHSVQLTGGSILLNKDGTKGNFLSNKMWLSEVLRLENKIEYDARVFSELDDSKKIIEQKLNKPVFIFAYPFGDYGQQQVDNSEAQLVIEKNLEKAGYIFAFRQVWEGDDDYTHNYRSDRNYLLKRIEPSPFWSGAELVERLSGGEEKLIPYRRDTFNMFDWRNSWGEIKLNDGELNVSTKNTSTGASIFLDGTLVWTNYTFNTLIDWTKGSHVSLVGRFKDENNYVACSFSDGGLRIEQFLNGKKRIMVEKETFFEMPKKDVQLGIAVNGDKVECLVNGNSVIYANYLSPALEHGGIGIKTWDPKVNNSEIVVKNVEVVEMTGDGKDVLAKLPKTELVLKETPTQKRKLAAAALKAIVPKLYVVNEKNADISIKEITQLYFTNPDGKGYRYDVDLATTTPWLALDGSIISATSTLKFFGQNTQTTSYFVLEGSEKWKDYSVDAIFDWKLGSSATILTRYYDSKNFMECSFSRGKNGGSVTLYSIEDGVRIKLYQEPRKLLLGDIIHTNKTEIGATVIGDDISCLFNNHAVFTYNHSRMRSEGAVGLKLWDRILLNTQIELSRYTVTQK